MSNYAVQVRDIVKTFRKGSVRALDGVSLDVPRGQVFGLLGPNGSGKTTMVRILSTVLAPDSGSATVGGFDVVKQADAVRRTIGLAGQFATVDENLTGYENLRMVGRLNHMTTKLVLARTHELLGQFGLDDAAHRPV
ncbi:MAG: ATP-binding cassette domain-containing protein, partial [Actinomycetota bacterium]